MVGVRAWIATPKANPTITILSILINSLNCHNFELLQQKWKWDYGEIELQLQKQILQLTICINSVPSCTHQREEQHPHQRWQNWLFIVSEAPSRKKPQAYVTHTFAFLHRPLSRAPISFAPNFMLQAQNFTFRSTDLGVISNHNKALLLMHIHATDFWNTSSSSHSVYHLPDVLQLYFSTFQSIWAGPG